MTKEEYEVLERIQGYFIAVIHDLEYLGKLKRIKQNLEFDLHEIEVYIEMMKEMDNG